MQPQNFPARKMLRRERALERIARRTRKGEDNSAHIQTLTDRIAIGRDAARAVRSKKDRSSVGRFGR